MAAFTAAEVTWSTGVAPPLGLGIGITPSRHQSPPSRYLSDTASDEQSVAGLGGVCWFAPP